MKYNKVNVVKKITFLLMTMALAVAMAACQAATPKGKTPVALGGATLSDMSFPDFVAGTDTAADKRVTITGSHFKGTKLKYTASSSNASVATATATGSVVTVTPKGAGTATVTVIAAATADDEEGTQSLSFTVTVTAPVETTPDPPPVDPPPDNNAPRLKAGKTLPHHTDLLFGDERKVDLSEYFTDDEGDAITYAADSTDKEVVTTSLSGSMLTITVVNHGDATITVTATDSHNQSRKEVFDVTVINQAPMKTDENTRFGPYSIGHEQEFNLNDFFTDIEGDPLTYPTVMPIDTTIATVTGPDADDMITIAAVAAGTAQITVIANDGANNSEPNILTVTVSAVPNEEPAVKMEIMDMTLNLMVMDMMESASKTINLTDHFEDPDGKPMPLEYSDDSDMTMIEGSMLTINADESDAGNTMTITVTATDGEAKVSDMFDVTVNAPDAPVWKKEIPDPPAFAHDGDDMTYMLEDYFRNATMYDARTTPSGVVTATVSADQTMLTLTLAVDGPGDTTVEITPSNSGGNGVTQSITVTVNLPAAVLQKPTLKPGKTIPMAVKVTAIARPDGATGVDTGDTDMLALLNSSEKDYDLLDLIKDPEGADADLEFMTETNAPATVAVYADRDDTGTDGTDDERGAITKATLDKMTTDASHIWIRGRKAGTATVTITASSDSGQSEKWTISVTVTTSNTLPSVVDGLSFPGNSTDDTDPYSKFVGLDNANRLKLNPPKVWKEKLDLATLFDDADVETNERIAGDSWTFKEMSTDEKVVTVRLESTNNSKKPDEYYVILTSVGSGDAIIYFTVTDSFGEKAGPATVPTAATETIAGTDPGFAVKVNSVPVAMGAQAEPVTKETLARLSDRYNDLALTSGFGTVRAADGITDISNAHEVDIGGYFSDADGDTLTCRFDLRGDDIFTDVTGANPVDYPSWDTTTADQLNLAATEGAVFKMKGTAHIDVWCVDNYDEASPKATLTIKVTTQGSIH